MLKFRFAAYSFILPTLAVLGGLACGTSGGIGHILPSLVKEIRFLNCPSQPLRFGDFVQLEVEGRDESGAVVANLNPDYVSDNPRLMSVDPQGKAVALYPGAANLSAEAEGVTSYPCQVTILPPENLLNAQRLTDNSDEDHWGQNNSWPMTARGQVLWQRIDGNMDTEILLHDRADAVGDDTSVDLIDFLSGGVDFMAFGGGAQPNSVLASYRVDLALTQVSADGQAPVNLGDRQQEENSIADGCFFFREGGGFNDIQRYTTAAGLTEILSAGDTYTPITSGCEAVWENRGAVDSELVYFDGQSTLPIASGLPAFPDFDFRGRRAVYALQGDVTLVDLTQNPPQTIPLTNDGVTRLDRNPRTDGETVVWHQTDGADEHIWMYDIATGMSRKISATAAPKQASSLQIDVKQVLWVEGTELWFHAGSGNSADTEEVDLNGIPLDPGYRPYLKDGLAAWVGNDGDTEIIMME